MTSAPEYKSIPSSENRIANEIAEEAQLPPTYRPSSSAVSESSSSRSTFNPDAKYEAVPVSEEELEKKQMQTTGKQSFKLTNVDGVFSNINAKPEIKASANVHKSTNEHELPTYAQVESEPVPDYSQITLFVPTTQTNPDGTQSVLINSLPAGTYLTFFVTMVFAFVFQIFGFMIALMFSTSNAGRIGARTGLGLSLIQLGFSISPESMEDKFLGLAVAFLGYFIVLQGTFEFWKVKRMERIMSARSSSEV